MYRSPWPLRLRDGRIVVLFARRRMPMGIGGVLSMDNGRTWSREFIVRCDGTHWDLGYPVACELADGRLFAAYYFNHPSPRSIGGTRHIARSHFRLPD